MCVYVILISIRKRFFKNVYIWHFCVFLLLLQDCNSDGVTDCDDFAMLHFHLKDDCKPSLDGTNFGRRYSTCRPLADPPGVYKLDVKVYGIIPKSLDTIWVCVCRNINFIQLPQQLFLLFNTYRRRCNLWLKVICSQRPLIFNFSPLIVILSNLTSPKLVLMIKTIFHK